MGRCGEGPVMAVYPDGVWYRNVSENDIEKIYKEHLIKDKIVPHIVDDIMT
jgi:(2Fe-2S) ferredoxin